MSIDLAALVEEVSKLDEYSFSQFMIQLKNNRNSLWINNGNYSDSAKNVLAEVLTNYSNYNNLEKSIIIGSVFDSIGDPVKITFVENKQFIVKRRLEEAGFNVRTYKDIVLHKV